MKIIVIVKATPESEAGVMPSQERAAISHCGLNRAVAVSMAYGPGAALELVDTLKSESRLRDYHLLPSVRGDLLERLGRFEEACAEISHAATLTQNAQEPSLLLQRAANYRIEIGFLN